MRRWAEFLLKTPTVTNLNRSAVCSCFFAAPCHTIDDCVISSRDREEVKGRNESRIEANEENAIVFCRSGRAQEIRARGSKPAIETGVIARSSILDAAGQQNRRYDRRAFLQSRKDVQIVSSHIADLNLQTLQRH